MAPTTRLLTAAALCVAALGLSPLSVGAASTSNCGGVVFLDLDADGQRIETLEHDGRADDVDPGVGGVPITVADAGGGTHTATSRRDGVWSVDLSATDYPIRIEFTVPADHAAGRPGPDSGSPIQYASSPDECDGRPLGNLGVFPVSDFCASRPEVAVPCHVTTRAPGYEDLPAIRAVSNAAVDDGSAGDFAGIGETTVDDWLQPNTRTLATHGEIGTVYGQAARRDGTLFAAAFTKRHTRSASELNPDGNPTVIYWIRDGGEPEVFITLDPEASDPRGLDDSGEDLEVMDAVFTTGIGDIELSPNESTLFAVDLGRRELVTIDVETAAITDRRALDGAALGRADCAVSDSAPFGDLRPFGLGWLGDDLLVGVVCSAASTISEDVMVREDGDAGIGAGDHDQLVGYVYRLEPDSVTELLAWPLAADRGETHSNGLRSNKAVWHPWTATYPFDDEHRVVSYPQPAITDIAVDSTGRLVLAIGDRWSHQTAPETDAPARDGSTRRITETVAAGDLQRACRRADGFVIEGTTGCSGGFGNGWEFFDGESYGWQAETALGSVARFPGRDEVVITQMNPVPEDHAWSSGGLVWHATRTGDSSHGVRLYDRQAAPSGSTFENASGLGDLAILCGGPDPSIGGAVWHDLDADGIRDPGDGPVAGVAIELVDSDGEVVAVDYADDLGSYSFDRSNVPAGLTDGDAYVLVLGDRNRDPEHGALAGLGEHSGLVATAPDRGDRDDLDSDGHPVIDPDDGWIGARIDVRVGDDSRTPQRESSIAHHYDFGLRHRYDLAVETSPGPAMREAGTVAFRIDVRNEGSLPSGPIEVRANLPMETSLRASGAMSALSTSTGGGSITWAFDEADSIAPGDVRTIDLELRVIDPSVETIVHRVEIVADSGRDEDSDPGTAWDEDDEAELVVDLFGLSGRIWVDVASDEVTRVERGAGGVVVNVLDDEGTIVGGTTTDDAGRFLFDSFTAGSYRIAIPATEFESGSALRSYDQAIGGYSANVRRMLDREGFVSTDPIELGAPGTDRSPAVEVGLLREPPKPTTEIVVTWLLLPLTLLCLGFLLLERRRHLGGALRAANRV